ncbi:hypothetical protein ACFLZC_00310 [Patescibacteria group bacterium]
MKKSSTVLFLGILLVIFSVLAALKTRPIQNETYERATFSYEEPAPADLEKLNIKPKTGGVNFGVIDFSTSKEKGGTSS